VRRNKLAAIWGKSAINQTMPPSGLGWGDVIPPNLLAIADVVIE
jgi:hypothetical protein